MTDYFLYSGEIKTKDCFRFIDLVEETKRSSDVALVLSTNGGDPDAAFKMGKCLQLRYDDVSIFVPGICKSAGTLLAIAANKLVFSLCYGELGPLDIQVTRKDGALGQESGLIIHEAFYFLEKRSAKLLHSSVPEIIDATEGRVSLQTASDFASRFSSSLFGPLLARIDPKEIGERSRSMRVAEEYGRRLNYKFENLEFNSPLESNLYVLHFLMWACPSHEFVIDVDEASALFKRVRITNELEENIIKKYRLPERGEPLIGNITDEFQEIENKEAKNTHNNSKKSKGDQTTSNERNEESRDKA